MARLGLDGWTATLCFLATTIVQFDLAASWVHPWTTTLSAALIWWLIDQTLRIVEEVETEPRARTLFVIGMLVMALPLTRPVDALIAATCLGVVVAAPIRHHRLSLRALGLIGAGGASVAGLYGGFHLAIYGFGPTAYMVASSQIGFIWSDLGWKAHVLLVDPRPWFPDSDAILERLPWIVPGMAGMIVAAIVGQRPQRRVVLLLLALILPISGIMLTYADLQPPGLWRFGNIHYFKWALPAFGAGIVLCYRHIRAAKDRSILGVVLIGLLLPLTISIEPIAVANDVPARMLLFNGNPRRSWHEAYFSPVVITDDRGTMANLRDFHQIPDAKGQRAIAISRAFARNPRRVDPGETQTISPQPPYARFGERLLFMDLCVRC